MVSRCKQSLCTVKALSAIFVIFSLIKIENKCLLVKYNSKVVGIDTGRIMGQGWGGIYQKILIRKDSLKNCILHKKKVEKRRKGGP